MPKENLLTTEVISRLNNLSLKARYVVEGFIVGYHKSPYHGFSVEFSEHRAYGAGDEIRHIDWKLWGKTDKYFIKQFEEETNLKTYIILDQSLSMTYKSSIISKIEYAKILSSSLSYLMLKQQDAVGLTLFDNKVRINIPPRSRTSHLNILLSHLQNIIPGPETSISPTLHQTAEKIKKKGLIILISDLFDDPNKILSGLQHFRYKGHEVIVFHILDPQELNLDFEQRVQFRDIETGEEIITDPRHIKQDYKNKINNFCDFFKSNCRKKNIDYIPLSTINDLNIALSEYLIKRKRIG